MMTTHSRLLRLGLSTGLGLAAAWLWLAGLAPAPVLLAAPVLPAAPAAPASTTFSVNSPADLPDATPGDGVCRTAPDNTICTLRAAIQEANALPDADIIQLQANTTYVLGYTDTNPNYDGNLDISHTVTLLGAGPDSTIIDGNGSALHERVFDIITGTVVISGVTIEHGQDKNIGGGLINDGSLTLLNSAIVSNTASGLNGGLNDWGGGIYNSGALTITHSLIAGNATGNRNAYGGGIYNQGLMLILSSTISDNQTYAGSGSPGQGGGLFDIGYTSTVMNSLIAGNTAAEGGGIYKGGYPLYVINSTIAGNDSAGDGGGIYAASGTTGLYNATLTLNRANSDDAGFNVGGGVFNAGISTLTFANSLIAWNEKIVPTTPFPTLDNDDCSGALTSQGHNLVYQPAAYCTINGPQPITQTDPLLGPLQDNGGPTLTFALLPGSPAIDAGNSAGCTDNLGARLTTDQRGRGRPAPGQGTCDIGAFEFPFLLNLPLLRR